MNSAKHIFVIMPNRKSEMTNKTKNLIIGMFKAGRKPFVIATELNINCSTDKFLNRYKETGSIENKEEQDARLSGLNATIINYQCL